MIVDAAYSIKATSNAWGVNPQEKSVLPTLNKIFQHIKNISRGTAEVTTPGPENNSQLRLSGKLKLAIANGHLILDPGRVDLRIVPGMLKSVTIKNIVDGRYQVIFNNKKNEAALRISFNSTEKIDPATQLIASTQTKLKPVDRSEGLENLWRGMTDVHHFYPMLKQFGISKLEAFREVPNDLARQVDISSVMDTLQSIHQSQDDFMAFVGNDAVIQIYSGPITQIAEPENTGKIFIHGRTQDDNPAIIKLVKDQLGQAWVVNKYSLDGPVTSLEIFDHAENHIIQLNGIRREGEMQKENWATLMQNLKPIAQ